MNSTTMNIPLNQITQSIKIECKTANSINVPYFFSTVDSKTKKDNNLKTSTNKEQKFNKKEEKKN